MYKNSTFLLRAVALALPLTLAAMPPLAHAQSSAKKSQASQKKAAPAAVVPTPFPADAMQHAQQLNADTATPELKQGDKGPMVIRAQVALDRNWFSVGEIDGNFGSNMARAINAFQLARGLPVTGRMDAATWGALGQQAPALATYTLTEKDLAGPYLQIPDDPMLQAELPSLAYQDMNEALAERFHMSPKLLAALNQGRTPAAGQAMVVTDVGRTGAMPKATSLRIDKSDKMLYIMGEGGKVMGAMPISIGSSQDPLPLGTLQITARAPNPDFMYNPDLLRNAKTDRKVKLPPGPNSPVGVMWLALTKEHWGIHGTAQPSQMARVETNGCIRLTNWDVVRLSTVVDKGINVEVQS